MRWRKRRQAPADTPADVPLGCRVVVLGDGGALRSLSEHLPATWSVTHADEVGDVDTADLLVLAAPTPGKIAAAHARQPGALLVAVAGPTTGVDTVVELLHRGASACVRADQPGLVAAHVLACSRRYPSSAA